jgi:microcystin-dependent protein
MMSKLTTAVALALGLSGGAAQAQELYIGQFVPVRFCFCPRDTTEAAGQLMAISENTALFSLLGTTYGGDGRTMFALPDLRRRAPIGQGPGPGVGNHRQRNKGGQEAVSITTNQMPSHAHGGAGTLTGSPPRHGAQPGTAPTLTTTSPSYAPLTGAKVDMAANSVTVTIGATGEGAAVPVMDPFLAIRYCIVTQGMSPCLPCLP